MAYVAPSTRATGTLITSAIWNQDVVANILHLASMKFGSVALSALGAGSPAMRGGVTSFTGNGSATQAITGLSFQPDIVILLARTSTATFSSLILKTALETTKAFATTGASAVGEYADDHIISLDAAGFTVGDGTGSANGNIANKNTVGYTAIVLEVS